MIGSSRSSFLSKFPSGAGAACGMLLFFTVIAAAQNSQPVPPPPPAHQPGMFDSIGQWFKDSFSFLNRNVEGAKDTMTGIGTRAGDAAKEAANAASNAATAAKDAAGAVTRLPGTRVVDGRARCDTAPNGAPDCQHAAEAVCRAKGFKTGSSLDITSAKDCPTEAYIRRETKDCKVASFVTRAACQ